MKHKLIQDLQQDRVNVSLKRTHSDMGYASQGTSSSSIHSMGKMQPRSSDKKKNAAEEKVKHEV